MQILPHAGPVFSPSEHLLGLILSLYLHSDSMGLGNPAPHCRQVQAHPTHCCVACATSCQQKGSLLAGLLMECRQQYPQWPLTVTSKIYLLDEQYPLQQQKNVSATSSHLTDTGAVKFPFRSRPSHSKQAVGCHAGLFSGRHSCLGPESLSGTEGTVGAALGTRSGTHNQKHGWGNQFQVDEQSQGSTVHWIGLRRVHDVCNYAALCWLQHREQTQLQMLLLLELKWSL